MLSLLAAAASSAMIGPVAPGSNLTVIEVDAGTWNGWFTVRALDRGDQVELKLVGRMDFLDKSPVFDAMMTWTLPLEAVRVIKDENHERITTPDGVWKFFRESVDPGVVTWTRRPDTGGSLTVRESHIRSLRLTTDQMVMLYIALLGDASEACQPSLAEALSTARGLGSPAGLASFEYACDPTQRAASVSIHVREDALGTP